MVLWTLESKVAHLATTKLNFKNSSCWTKTAWGRELKCLPLSMVPTVLAIHQLRSTAGLCVHESQKARKVLIYPTS